MSSIESKKERTDSGVLLEHDVGIVSLPKSWQEALDLVVGKTLGMENQWLKVSAELIIKDVWENEDETVFHSYKDAIQDYTLPDMYVGYDPLRTGDDEFLVCTTHEGFEYLDQKIRDENEKFLNVGRMREPHGWHSMGSEKEVEAARVYSTRLKMSLEIDVVSRLAKPRAPLTHVEPDAFELRPMSKEVFDLVERTQFDVSVQAVPRTFTVEAQTDTPYGRNAAIQSDPVDELRTELIQTREEMMKETMEDKPEVVEDMVTKLKAKVDVVLPHLKEELPPHAPPPPTSVGDSDEDTVRQVLPGTKKKEKKIKKPSLRGFEVAEEFVDVVSLSRKKISSVSWHPNYAGIVAVAYSKRVPTDSDPDIDAKTDIDDILGVTETLLSYEDSDTESMILPPIEKPNLTETGAPNISPAVQEKVELAAAIEKVETREQDMKKLRQCAPPARARLNKELLNNIDKSAKPDYKKMLDAGNQEKEATPSMPWRDLVKKRVHYLDTLAVNFQTIQSFGQEHVAGNSVIKMLESVLTEDSEGKNISGEEIEEEDEMILGKLRRAASCKRASSGESNVSDRRRRSFKKYDPSKSLLSSPSKKMEKQGMTHVFRPSNLVDLMQKRRETSKSVQLKRLAPSVRAAMNQHKKDTLSSLCDTMLVKRDKGVGNTTGKVIAEDPARDPMAGATHAVFLWSVTDNLMPALVLDSPDVVNVVEFCPHDGNIIAAGLECGMIALWDITGRLETTLAADKGNDVNSVRKSLEGKLSWVKSLCSVRVVKPVVLSKRECSHLHPVIHLQWLHPLLRVSASGDVHSVLKKDQNRKDTRSQLSYQLVSCSLYGKFRFWDCKPNDAPTPFRIRHNRPMAEQMFGKHREETAPWSCLSRVWKPFLKINPTSPQSTGLELPSYVISKFCVQQPPIVYKPSAKPVKGTALHRYKIAMDSFKLDFPFTMNLCTFDGRTCLAGWGPKKGAGIKWSSWHHDGVVTSLSSCRFYDKLKLTSGGREWCIWHNDYKCGPILWKSYLSKVSSAIWSPFKPGGMFIGLDEGSVEVWDLLRSTIHCVDKILCKEPPTVLSCSPHLSLNGCYLGVGDVKGKFQLWAIPMEHWTFSDDEVKRFRSLCDCQPSRKKNNFEWSQTYRQSHPNIVPVFDTLAKAHKERKAAQKEELKREQEEIQRMWLSRKRVKKSERDDYEEKLNQMTEARQKKHYLTVREMIMKNKLNQMTEETLLDGGV
uniref:WD repeat-containing protein 63 n=1 Tax=Cacopsylla melanoneura TaxID=428564 RepID=A0A8D8V4W7_9HEMI